MFGSDTGFFNVGVSADKRIGSDGETIELFLGASESPVFGSIKRRANPNVTPRIMGEIGLRDWFIRGVAGSTVTVDVLSRNAIRLSRAN